MKIKVSFLELPELLLLTFILLVFLNCSATNQIPGASIVTDRQPGVYVLHGLTKLTDALQAKNITFEKVGSVTEAKGKLIILTGLSSGEGDAAKMLKAGNHVVPEVSEALTIWKTNHKNRPLLVIAGFDDRGLMYGLLDVAIQIGWGTDKDNPVSEVREITEKPDVSERAISFYTMNRAYWESRFYDEVYWVRYLDLLAQNRFNSMVVIFGYENGGFLAPCYPYFFDTEGFSDVRMVGITPQEQQRNLYTLNNLIKMAHDRGIQFTVGIWDHIYRGGVQGGGIPGTKDSPDKPVPGLVWGVTGDNLISYTKTALAKFVKLVPDLDAIQFRMHSESGLKTGEQDAFWSDVFKMMKKAAPDLRLDLRAKELPGSVVQSALDIGIKFRITTKYWMEQMGMPFHPTQINPEKSPRRHSYADMLSYPQQYKMHWRLWNGGTARVLLWGDPEYVRRFAESTHLYDGDGYEVNEPLATKMEAQPHDAKPFELLNPQYRYYDYEFERYWHFFQVFGRLFERTRDASALDEAIAYERKAIDAWRQIVDAAGDVYTYDLMMGVRSADLCGHWRDELDFLETGLEALEQKRAAFKAEDNEKKAPHYKVASRADWYEQFQITHLPVTTIQVEKPLKVSVKVTTQAGVKYVKLSYRSVNQEMEYQTIPMLPTGEKDTFEATVPAEQINPKWDFMYFIKIMDNNGKGIIYPDLNRETPYLIVKLIR